MNISNNNNNSLPRTSQSVWQRGSGMEKQLKSNDFLAQVAFMRCDEFASEDLCVDVRRGFVFAIQTQLLTSGKPPTRTHQV